MKAIGCLFLLLSAGHLEEIAYGVYRVVYVALAKQILKDTGVRKGVLVDIGCGHGYVGWELAKLGDFVVYGVDIDPKAVEWAREKAKREGLERRAIVLRGDALDLPLGEGFADLVVSRGMAPFMSREDRIQVYCEAWRILKPGGVAYIGGGFSRYLPEELIKRIARMKGWKEGQPASCYIPPEKLTEELREAGIKEFRILVDRYPEAPYGAWVMFRKPLRRIGLRPAFAEDFDRRHREGTVPRGWVFPHGNGWAVRSMGDRRVLEHSGRGEGMALVGCKGREEGFVVQVDLQLGEGAAGGVVACWSRKEGGFCLRIAEGGLELARLNGGKGMAVLRSVAVRVKRWRWWTLKLEVVSQGRRARLRGKAWREGQPEPPGWNIVVEEAGLSGLCGLWASSEVRFDNFLLFPLRGRT